MDIAIAIGVIFLLIAIWFNVLATLAIKYDYTLEKPQKIAQLVFVWLIPILGAGFVLHLVFDHSPDIIPRAWIPWPFKGLIYGKAPKSNKNRDEHEIDTVGRRHHDDYSGGGDGGGGGSD